MDKVTRVGVAHKDLRVNKTDSVLIYSVTPISGHDLTPSKGPHLCNLGCPFRNPFLNGFRNVFLRLFYYYVQRRRVANP